MNKPLKTFYLLHGDDGLSIEEAAAKLRAAMGSDDLNTNQFDGQNVSAAEVINAVSSYPFLADRRLVIVKGLLAWLTRKGAGETGKKQLELLESALPTLPAHARLLLVEPQKLPENNKIVKLAQNHANGYEKCFVSPKDTTSWIIKRAKEAYGVEIEPRAAVALASVTGPDLRAADSEIDKLALYSGGAVITEKDVAALTAYVAEATLFEMVDALAEGRAKAAVSLIHTLMGAQKEEPLAIYGMIVRQFRLLLLAREYLAGGGSPGNLAAALNIHSYSAQKLAKQSRAFNVTQLEKIYRALLETDVKIKTGRIKPELALDLLVSGLV